MQLRPALDHAHRGKLELGGVCPEDLRPFWRHQRFVIRMSRARTAAQVAADIDRRLLPGYSHAVDQARVEQRTRRLIDDHRGRLQRELVEAMGGDITRTREVSLRPRDAVVSVPGWLVDRTHDVAVAP